MQYLNVFSKSYLANTPETGVTTPSDLSYLRRLYQFNKDSIQTYYQERNFSVKNTHILSRLLEHFPIYPNYDSYRYLEFANNTVTYLAKHFKFTSDIEKGVVHPPYFFGNDGEEIIISSYEPFDVEYTTKHWKTVNVIKTLSHPRDDLKLLLPLGNDNGSRGGIAVLSVNIPQLAIKYREFIKEQVAKSYSEEPAILLTKNHFVMKYVLGTAMPDIVDHIFLNKLMDKFYGREEVEPKFKHRFKLFEPDTQINRYIENTLDFVTNKKLDYINLLRHIQLMYSQDASELLSLEEFGMTRQVKWAVIVSRLDHMLFLFDVGKKDVNRVHLNDWKRLIGRLLRDNSFEGMFSYNTEQVIKEKMYKLSQI